MQVLLSQHRLARSRGASRLEFAAALIVIGLLAWVLLGRLAELSQAARRQYLVATVSSVRAVATIFHARCQVVRAGAPAACDHLQMGDEPVDGVQGWPAASVEGIARAAALSGRHASMPAGRFVLHSGTVGGLPALFIALGDPRCEFFYAQATSPGDSPEVDIVDASCP